VQGLCPPPREGAEMKLTKEMIDREKNSTAIFDEAVSEIEIELPLILDDFKRHLKAALAKERLRQELPEFLNEAVKEYDRTIPILKRFVLGFYLETCYADVVNEAIEESKRIQEHEKQKIIESLRNNDFAEIKMGYIFIIYPDFEKDFKLLEINGYLTVDINGLHWLKSKQSLAEYFGEQCQNKSVEWKPIEELFRVKHLKNIYSSNGNIFKKRSKDYENWLAIKNNFT
jgi:hypothetical protein